MDSSVDWKELVEREFLDLEALMEEEAEYSEVMTIGTFHDEKDILCKVILQKAKRFGVTAYRWIGTAPDDPQWDKCCWQISRENVIEDGKDVIFKCDKQTQHLPAKQKASSEEQLILNILGTHWFEDDVDKDMVRDILDYATYRSEETDLIVTRNGYGGSILSNEEYNQKDCVFVVKQDSRKAYAIAIREAIEKQQGEILAKVR